MRKFSGGLTDELCERRDDVCAPGTRCAEVLESLLACRGRHWRAERIAVFRQFMRNTGEPTGPLPPSLQHQAPPPQLRASWSPGSQGSKKIDFHLDRFEVLLTSALLSDDIDIDDMLPLPILEINGSLPARHHGGDEWTEVLPSTARRSVLYRAALPAESFWALRGTTGSNTMDDGTPGTLEVWLPDGQRLLQHVFQPTRWLPARRQGKMLQGAACEAAGAALDPEQGWCSERHGVKRLCYALYNDGAATDCEHGHRSPVYVPLGTHDGSRGEHIELVLRGRMDAYVYASETTGGCSNCLGRPYGQAHGTGAELFACGDDIMSSRSFQPGQRCFGDPPRIAQALGLANLGLAFAQLSLAAAFIRGFTSSALATQMGASKAMVSKSATASGVLLLSAIAVHLGLAGMLHRTLRRSHPIRDCPPMLLLAAAGLLLLTLVACARVAEDHMRNKFKMR